MKKLFTSMFLILGLNACSGVGFMDRTDLVQYQGTENIDELKYTGYGQTRKIKTLGAVSIMRFDEETGEKNPMMLDLKKNKSRFYAETMLFESDNKEKSFFDQTIFNVGVDKKKKGLNVELSFKF